MNKFGVNVEGMEEIQVMMKILPKRVNNKITPKALKRAGKVLIKAAKAKVNPNITFKFKSGKEVSSKELKKIISVVKGKPGNKYIVVGVKVSASDPFYNLSNWVEYGTLAKRTEPLKKSRSAKGQAIADKGIGSTKSPFMRPALMQTKGQIKKIFKSEMLIEIPKEVNKILKKGKL